MKENTLLYPKSPRRFSRWKWEKACLVNECLSSTNTQHSFCLFVCLLLLLLFLNYFLNVCKQFNDEKPHSSSSPLSPHHYLSISISTITITAISLSQHHYLTRFVTNKQYRRIARHICRNYFVLPSKSPHHQQRPQPQPPTAIVTTTEQAKWQQMIFLMKIWQIN